MLFLGMVVLAACSESQKAPVQQPSAVSKSLPRPITQGTPTVVEQKATPEFSYNPAGRRDPFSRSLRRKKTRQEKALVLPWNGIIYPNLS